MINVLHLENFLMNPLNWSSSEVANYLQQIGLGQYSEKFLKNNITGSTLPSLNDQKLKKLGVNSVGHRIKIFRFIETLGKSIEDNYFHICNDSFSLNVPITRCSICHKKILSTFCNDHEKACNDEFQQRRLEYQKQGFNLTDEDIVDLINGKLPLHHLKLEKCRFCGRKITPNELYKHEMRCKQKMSYIKQNDSTNQSPDSSSIDFRKKHEQLIEFIQSQRKEMNQAFFSETNFPIVKTEATEVI